MIPKNKLGSWFTTAPIRRPPAEPPIPIILFLEVYLFSIKYLATAM